MVDVTTTGNPACCQIAATAIGQRLAPRTVLVWGASRAATRRRRVPPRTAARTAPAAGHPARRTGGQRRGVDTLIISGQVGLKVSCTGVPRRHQPALLDFRRVPVPSHPRPKLSALAGQVVDLSLPAPPLTPRRRWRSGEPDRPRQPAGDQPSCGRAVATGQAAGATGDRRAVYLGQAIYRLGQQLGTGVEFAMPARPLAGVPQAVIRRQVSAGYRGQRISRLSSWPHCTWRKTPSEPPAAPPTRLGEARS